jgi:hypothetical protein
MNSAFHFYIYIDTYGFSTENNLDYNTEDGRSYLLGMVLGLLGYTNTGTVYTGTAYFC